MLPVESFSWALFEGLAVASIFLVPDERRIRDPALGFSHLQELELVVLVEERSTLVFRLDAVHLEQSAGMPKLPLSEGKLLVLSILGHYRSSLGARKFIFSQVDLLRDQVSCEINLIQRHRYVIWICLLLGRYLNGEGSIVCFIAMCIFERTAFKQSHLGYIGTEPFLDLFSIELPVPQPLFDEIGCSARPKVRNKN